MNFKDEKGGLALAAGFVAAALLLGFVETMIPLPMIIPGLKLGLANAAVVVALVKLPVRDAALVALAKLLATGLLFGSPVMLAFSAGGTALAFVGMLAVVRLMRGGAIVTSIVGAILHNIGQLAVACLVLGNAALLYLAIPLSAIACATGCVTGLIAKSVVDAFARREELGMGVADASTGGTATDVDATDTPASEAAIDAEAVDAPAGGAATDGKAAADGQGVRSGLYQPGDSVLHRVNPGLKILGAIAFVIAGFVAQGWLALTALLVATLVVVILSRMSAGQIARVMKPTIGLLLFVLVYDVLFTGRGDVYWEFGVVSLSSGGLEFAAQSAIRFVCALLASATLMTTTSPEEIVEGATGLMGPRARESRLLGRTLAVVEMVFLLLPFMVGKVKTNPSVGRARSIRDLVVSASDLFVESVAEGERIIARA